MVAELHTIDTSAGFNFDGAFGKTANATRAIDGATAGFQLSLARDSVAATLDPALVNMFRVSQTTDALKPSAAAASAAKVRE